MLRRLRLHLWAQLEPLVHKALLAHKDLKAPLAHKDLKEQLA